MRFPFKVILMVSFLTAGMALYVHGQIAILHTSYRLDKSADKLQDKNEEYRRLKFEVDQLKAPRFLEETMKKKKLDLGLPKEVRVIRMPLPVLIPDRAGSSMAHEPVSGGGLNFWGRWIKVAQAKVDR